MSELTKKKKTASRRQDFNIKRLPTKWKHPRGMHSQQRKKTKGHPKGPRIGYSTPLEIRGLHPSGLMPLLVNSLGDLNDVQEKQGILLSTRVGKRKRIQILEKAKEKNLTVLNIKDSEAYIKNIQEALVKKKEEKTKKKEKKDKTKKEAEKKAKEASKKEEKTVEEKVKQEKEVKRKVLEDKKQVKA